MNENDFLRHQQAAVERMREMNARSSFKNNQDNQMPPVPSFVKINENNKQNFQQQNYQKVPEPKFTAPTKQQKQQNLRQPQQKKQTHASNINIPFIDKLLSDNDATLIIGLLLILLSENSDKKLLFALVYILL